MALRDFFENFIYNFQNDPNRNKKIIFFAAWGIGLVLIGIGIWTINQPKTAIPTTENVVDSSLSDDFLDSITTRFPESKSLKPVVTKKLKNDRNFIVDTLGNPLFISSDGSFMAGETVILKESPTQSILSIYPIKQGYILNDYTESFIIIRDSSTGLFSASPAPTGITQIVPLNTGIDEFGFTSKEEYYFMVKSDTGYILKKSAKLDLSESQNLTNIESNLASSGFYQLWRSRNTLIISLFDSPAQQGNAEYWSFKNGKLSKMLEKADNWSTLVQENYLIITRQTLYSEIVSSYVNEVYDLSGETPKLIDFAPPFEIRKLSLFGNMLARRCAVSTANQIYCLIKEKPARTDNRNEPDVVVRLDISKKTAEILSSNSSIPASSSMVFDTPRKRLLISNINDQLVYELPTN